MFLMCFDPGIIIPRMLLNFFFTEIQYNSIYDKNFYLFYIKMLLDNV